MSPFPVQMENHWRPEPGVVGDRAHLMWFMLVGDYPQVAELAQLGQARLGGLANLDLVPREWLHITTLIAGFADEVTAGQVDAMTGHARRLLAQVASPSVTLGRILYHPRAVMLDAGPADRLRPVLQAVQEATLAATGHEGTLHTSPWTPHITLAYGNATQPAGPVIDALGRVLPGGEVAIRSVSLVSQTPDQMFRWDVIADVPFGGGEP